MYPRRLVSFPATNPSFGQGYPLSHWELSIDEPRDLRTEQIHDLDDGHARVSEDINEWMIDVAGPNWKSAKGTEKAVHIATQRMMDLETGRYQADELLDKHSAISW